jgi:hypothetical protein
MKQSDPAARSTITGDWLPSPDKAVWAMCDKCVDLDEKIGRYRRMSNSINDQFTIERIRELILDAEAQKAALHSEKK